MSGQDGEVARTRDNRITRAGAAIGFGSIVRRLDELLGTWGFT